MIYAIKNIDTGEVMYIKDESPLAAIKKAIAIIPGAETAKIETLYNVYYFKHKGEMHCCVRSEGGEQQ